MTLITANFYRFHHTVLLLTVQVFQKGHKQIDEIFVTFKEIVNFVIPPYRRTLVRRYYRGNLNALSLNTHKAGDQKDGQDF